MSDVVHLGPFTSADFGGILGGILKNHIKKASLFQCVG